MNGGNDIFSSIISVLPTIGQVIGGLLSAERENGYIGFFPQKGGVEPVDKCVFTVKDGKYIMNNISANEDDVVSIVFDETEKQLAQSATLEGMGKLDVTGLFRDEAKMANDEFTLTTYAGNAAKGNGNDKVSLNAGARNIKVGANGGSGVNATYKLGSYLEISLNSDFALISVAPTVEGIWAITRLEIGRMDRVVQILINPFAADTTPVESVKIPVNTLPADDVFTVSINADVKMQKASRIPEGMKQHFSKLSEEDLAQLRGMKKIN